MSRGRRWSIVRDFAAAGWNLLRMPGRSHRGPLPLADERLLQLAAELRRHVSYLSEVIGERNVRFRPRELARAAEYLTAEFVANGHQVQRQEYEVDRTVCANLEVEIPGVLRPDEIVIIGAHYDSVPDCPAANDNGSGVAALLSLSRIFANTGNDRTLRLVAFVNEEQPYAHTPQMGSWVHARRCRERNENVTAMFSLETIGCYSDQPGSQKYPPGLRGLYPSTGNFIAFVGHIRYGELVHQSVRVFRRNEPFPCFGGAMPDAVSDFGRSDHWPFWQEGYPALMVTDTAPFRYRYYHTPEDTLDKINFERTARVVRGLEQVIVSLLTVR